MTDGTHAISGTVWRSLGALLVCAGIVSVVVIGLRQGAQSRKDQTSAPSVPLTIEQKYDVLDQLEPRAATTNTAAEAPAPSTTAAAEEVRKEETVNNISATSEVSTQSEADKLDVLNSLGQ